MRPGMKGFAVEGTWPEVRTAIEAHLAARAGRRVEWRQRAEPRGGIAGLRERVKARFPSVRFLAESREPELRALLADGAGEGEAARMTEAWAGRNRDRWAQWRGRQ